MVASTGPRAEEYGRDPRPAGSAGARREAGAVLLVAATPADAAVLLAGTGGPGEVAVVCLESGGPQERQMFDRAVSDAVRQGRRVRGEPRVLASRGDGTQAVLDELRAVRPAVVLTTGPDAPSGTPAGDPGTEQRRTAAASAALRAADAYQRESGQPLLVDCREPAPTDAAGPLLRPRYAPPGTWLIRGNDGRLSGYLPTAGAVLRWTEGVTGGWSGPERLEAPGLLPGLTVVQGPDGYVRLVGLRRTEGRGGAVTVDVVCATQYQTGRPAGPWHSLGNPHRAEPERGRHVGFPVAAFDDDGTLHVFIRNDEHTVNTRHEKPNGSWSSWQHLRGAKTADELVALRVPDGRVELFARLRDAPGTARWSRTGRDGAWAEDTGSNVHAAADSLAPAPESGALRYRYAGTGELCQWQWNAPGPVTLHSSDAMGRVAGATGADIGGWACTVLVSTDAYGYCLAGFHVDGRPDSGVWWSSTEQWCLVPPALVRDRLGRITIAALGPDARLAVTRQLPGGQGLDLAPWA
ncbi:hypothetical protein [Streptomyces sp. NBC_01306]|uniref:hypothetical protein n=1 Tax=Streptomyces sp. NBC_01306 TaxID=2903819 RepID=UPI002254C86F|nr:hypothetical protein [Streptomyces sp. NBC_01306]MCX4723060.1 hypothetical protein [Streptomyces sp. NBC_01306]